MRCVHLYSREISSSQDTTVDRLQRTLALARQNKADRDDRRRQFAQEQYMRMWRAGCDDLRTLDSEAYARFTKAEQDKQRQQRSVLSQEERAEEARWLDVWEEDKRRKLQREQEDASRRAVAAVEMRDAIAKQMQERADQRQVRISSTLLHYFHNNASTTRSSCSWTLRLKYNVKLIFLHMSS